MDRKEYTYYKFMKKVVEDDYISLDESGLIMILEERLGLSDDQMDEMMGMIEDKEEADAEEMKKLAEDDHDHMMEKDVYERVLKEASHDEQITDRELDILDELASIMNVTIEERRAIYDRIGPDEETSRRLSKAMNLD